MADDATLSWAAGTPLVHYYHGAGYVIQTESLTINGTTETYLHLQLLDSSTIRIPAAKAAEVLRQPAVNNDVYRRLVNILKNSDRPVGKKWHEIQRDTHDRLRTGKLEEIAKAVRDMLPSNVPESNALLRQALRRLLGEVALSRGISPPEAARELAEATGQRIVWPKSRFDMLEYTSSDRVRQAAAQRKNKELEQAATAVLEALKQQ